MERKPAVHIIGILLFIIIPLLFTPHLFTKGVVVPSHIIFKDVFTYSLLVGFFYLHYFRIIPEYFVPQRYWDYAFIISLIFLAIMFVPTIVFHFILGFPYPKPFHYKESEEGLFAIYITKTFKSLLFPYIGVMFASLAFVINKEWKKLIEDKERAELSYLKAQLNPHFLFNTLNSIYSLALIRSANTPKAILGLSSLMRYVITESKEDYVALDNELNYIRSYIDLQKIRLGDTVDINYSSEGETEGKNISPILLIPFIENAFKHGVNPEENSQIDIFISVQGYDLLLKVTNAIVEHKRELFYQGGVGVQNAKNQLRVLYPNKHSLKIEEVNACYLVTLKINLS
jgi:sensor histidine kinase YesM